MRVLLVGSGGREHAMAAAIARSPRLEALFIAPGNPGTAALGTNRAVKADDVAGLIALAQQERIDLVVPGPEAPLVAGLADACKAAGIACAGPTQAAAALEGSKTFTKEVCDAANIPTARWERFDAAAPALDYVRRHGAPVVVKADGLAAGKGVVVAQSVAEAEQAITDMMTDGTLGQAGHSVVIEDCLVGDEVSLFAFCAGETAVLIGAAQDHKRIGDGDTGPNTGGMGAVSPPTGFGRAEQEAALDVLVRPMLREMARRGTPFTGIIFAGLMLTGDGPQLIEYNVRFGDPEAEALLIRLESDLLAALAAVAKGDLAGTDIRFSGQSSISVIMAAKGYPGRPVTGGVIRNLAAAQALPGVHVFQAGTKGNDAGEIVAAGGRVLAVCATGDTLAQACTRAYEAVGLIDWPDGIYRHDIGQRALAAQEKIGEQ
ncbi:phosphoribosylamine--glycine ligase [Komagataeibacter nataicola]|uniref:Phosphoribosylamine--glycine ligase n=1 Tax=Komagataeibacter nataicola TaxID=265960 RepID=A0A9N7CNI9_9PROT|nr:phosphoribosylamine--glycine ligase [Komagataeibacter nataicola]AQU87784.1 phosphoribosylamine--glycine ligase [Komagataeibacter nataicola]PYD66180.1 phosphoribosylamine--glycine ligase [Komagataeibacter nataicola]WEQ55527.1 phosphoribosylamine--glycine ligase [Komagataeibacter nataicola]WNM09618.1 phosphoribosylamine--glycine ligase [Komagataeibacter nataicola]